MIRVTCAIIVNDNRVLICKRGPQMNNPGKWEFPGGKIKPEETEEECIIREIQEELNISIEPRKQIRHFAYGSTIELIPFICSGYDGKILLREHADYRFCHSEEFRNYDFTSPDVLLYEYLLKNPDLLG
ncbi:(deoxy)nucleoside triphosphate pyrophosphohydrolase [Saccharicrinis sp. FJH2]|uniref:(deoxy)nucleoside triphosphate pyrophosphohydrolase n=1 Tax=Saccharicrinis sp. FJH65 TaxID=3344659 RepID=UPI0035F3E7D7